MDYDGFERRMLLRQIAYIDEEIARTRRDIARHGETEIDCEILRLQEETRKNYSKCLAVMMEGTCPQKSLREMVEASGSGEPPMPQIEDRERLKLESDKGSRE